MLETLDPIRKLGEGGEGTVWLAWDRALSRWLAVKIIRLAPGARAAGERLLAGLAPAARELLEPTGAPILTTGILERPDPRFGVSEGLALYIVMPYLHGLPAHELARGPLPTRDVAALFAEAVRSLTRLHARGLAHLDLKPSNVIVDVQGRPWLVDMHASAVKGTSGYAAPEQSSDSEAGPPADWYALGRTLAALWTGRYPRSAAEPLPELPRPAVSLTGPERLAHERLAELIDRLTRDDPANRPVPTAEEADALARDLGAAEPPQALAAAVAQSPCRGQITEIERVQAAASEGKGIATPPAPLAARRRAGGAVLYAAALALGIIALVTGARFAWNRDASPQPVPAPASSPKPVDRTAYARPLGPAEEHALHHGLWQLTVDFPVKRVTLKVLDGPELWANEAPKAGDFVKLDMVPDIYVLQTVYDDDHVETRQFPIRGGSEERWVTHPYRSSAPIQ